MKFPHSMLLDMVNTDLTAEQVGDLLTMAGFELEGIEEVEGDSVLDIKVMSNRGDGLSVFGLAREVLAKDPKAEPTDLYTRAANRFESDALPGEPNPAKVTIETTDCTRYACRIFKNVTNGESPEWMQKRLTQAGMRPISLLVDITNYVLLEVGQPLHAFDYEKLKGGEIIVRKARAGEKLTTLNGTENELREDQMMICDAERPVAAAGIMGGLDTEVDENTKVVLLESAHFLNTSVRRTRKQLGLNTEASYRFERSVDPDGVVAAIERFTELLGLPGSEIVDVYPNKRGREAISVRVDRARLLLGMEIREDEAHRYFQRLGMELAGHGDPFYVIPPTWRPDLVREIDLIEELGRVHGYDRIPECLPQGVTTQGGPQGPLLQVDLLREAAIRAGFIQIISHSLRDLHSLDKSKDNRVGPRAPASPDMAHLRDSLLPSLTDAVQRNGSKNLHLFEVGKVFSDKGGYEEHTEIAFISTGELVPASRKGEVVPSADFFSLKGSVEAVSHAGSLDLEFVTASTLDARLHPTRQAQLLAGGQIVGVLGQIHPDIAAELKLPAATFLASINVADAIAHGAKELSLKTISRNPAVGRDIALLIDKSVPYKSVEEAITIAAGEVLEKQWLFDVFDGQGIPEGKHSLGIGLQFRKVGGNFTDEEANQVREQIVAELVKLGGTTR